MTGSGRPRGPDPDDWFDEPDTADAWTARTDRLARERQAQRASASDADDWLQRGPVERPERSIRERLGRRSVVAAAALALLLLFGILAAAGVFSGSPQKAAATSTAHRPRPTPTTTAALAQPKQPLPTTPLKPGDHGAAVVRLQRALEQLGYSPGGADGQYGPATTQAVTRFQQAQGLTADGIVGPQTLAALERALRSG